MLNRILRIIIEKITKKTCNNCIHCLGGYTCDNIQRYARCTSSIYPNGFESKNIKKYECVLHQHGYENFTYKIEVDAENEKQAAIMAKEFLIRNAHWDDWMAHKDKIKNLIVDKIAIKGENEI